MASLEHIILSLIPFLIMFILLLKSKMKTYNVILITYILTFLTLFFIWKMYISDLIFSSIKGILLGLEIYLIIFSVLLLFNMLKDTKRIDKIKNFLKTFSDDPRIHVIFIGFFLVLFFESIAGFGTPAAVCAPILVSFGIRPITAVIICLISDTFAVSFGAFGTPLLKGIGTSVSEQTLTQIGFQVGILTGFVSIFVPLFLLIIYSKLEKEPLNIKKYLPFVITSGIIYGTTLILLSKFLPLEMPSVIASIISIIIIGIILKLNIFNKKNKNIKNTNNKIFSSLLPYLIIIILLLIKTIIEIPTINFNLNENIKYSISLSTPGLTIGIVALIFIIIFANKIKKKIIAESFNDGKNALYTLLITLAFVQILIYSEINQTNIKSIPEIIASLFSSTGIIYVFFSPIIGAFGSFLAGSVTVSNLIFTPLQQSAATINNIPQTQILALQTVGASAGNMIALHNIIAALAVVKTKIGIKEIFQILFWIALFTCLLFSIISLLLF